MIRMLTEVAPAGTLAASALALFTAGAVSRAVPRWNQSTPEVVRLMGAGAVATGVGVGVGEGVGVGATAGVSEPLEDPPPPPLVPPVPVSEIDCGEPGALSVSTSDALRAPLAPGVNVTPIAQVAPMGMLALEHVSDVMAKSLAFVPETAAAPAPNVKVLEPALEIANVVAEDVEPIVTVPKAPDVGEAETIGAATCTEPAVKAPDLVVPVWSVVMPVPSASGA